MGGRGMKNIMISQPMNGLTAEEINEVKSEAIKVLDEIYGSSYQIKDTFFHFDDERLKTEGVTNISLFYLAASLEVMSQCDGVYFCEGWRNNRGCVIEHQAAELYGVEIIKD